MECDNCQGINWTPIYEHDITLGLNQKYRGKEILVQCDECGHWQIKFIEMRIVDPKQKRLITSKPP